ncbi:MAG TPA: beta-ketoacyl synthase, partial [Leeuwenhoekiella sp.]|nr:beta-ketoacyl synthase [Leeuwenhoekiella sp.]
DVYKRQDLQNNGPEISHSITCSTALHALLNGVAWLQAGMCDKFLVGGSEAALTPFTIAQMQAMKTYSRANAESKYPCLAFDLDKTENTMVLGEGSASMCLELGEKGNTLAYVAGVGYATEKLKHAVSISAEAECFQKSMKMAIVDAGDIKVDAVVMHAPGTIVGDASEFKAIKRVFGAKLPLLTTNKWKIGHTFGASGLLSLDLAVHMLQTQQFIGVPFIAPQGEPQKVDTILVNAVGFGGNAVSILLRKA